MGDRERTKNKHAKSWDQVGWEETHNSLNHFPRVWYIPWQTRKWDSKSAEQQFLGPRDLVVIRNGGTCYFLHSLFLSEGPGVNILALMQSSCAAFCSHSLLELGAVPIPACRLFDMAVLMSSSHRLLILHSPHMSMHFTLIVLFISVFLKFVA
jgi:hypothetical protein